MNHKSIKARLLHRLGILGAAAVFVATLLVMTGADAEKPEAANHYVGADTCKNCHSQKEKGDQYHVWKGTKHSAAFEILASDKAKEYAKKAGVDNPQADAKCLQCHETAYGEPKENLAKTFKDHQGVQCESCHGPGGNHMTARMKAIDTAPAADDGGFGDVGEGGDKKVELQKIPAGEIILTKEATCLKCHNDKSPGWPGKFDFTEMAKKIEHPNPLKPKPEAPK